MGSGEENATRSPIVRALTLVAVLFFIVWWWWPGLDGQGTESEISVLATSSLGSAESEIGRRLREEGFSITWINSPATWCDLRDVMGRGETPKFVVAPADLAECAQSSRTVIEELDAADRLDQVVLVDLEESPRSRALMQLLVDAGAQRVATERLLGGIDDEVPCVWWEDCDASGRTVTRTATGLTAHGRDRLARLITAALV